MCCSVLYHVKLHEILEGTIARTESILATHLNPEERATTKSDTDEEVLSGAAYDQNEVIGGKTPHTMFLKEALPITVYEGHHDLISEVEDEYGFPFKILMDHSSELQESLNNYIQSTKDKIYGGRAVEDTT